MPSPTKGTILLTGSNGGLGSAIAQTFIQSQSPSLPPSSDLHFIFLVRSADKATILHDILHHAPADFNHEVLSLDLSSLPAVREVATEINTRVSKGELQPIMGFILNAGFQEQTTQTFSPNGFDMAFQVNYLSQFLLVLLLLKSFDKERAKIVVIGSWSHE